jgi:hypothetical protein
MRETALICPEIHGETGAHSKQATASQANPMGWFALVVQCNAQPHSSPMIRSAATSIEALNSKINTPDDQLCCSTISPGLDSPHGGPVLPHSKREAMPGKAPIVMFEAIQQQYCQHPEQGPVQLVCTGALSNAAMLLLLYPEVKPMIEITIMGGAMGVSWLTLGL